jgi:hypothetical protein
LACASRCSSSTAAGSPGAAPAGIGPLLRYADEAALVGDHDELRPIMGVQLHHLRLTCVFAVAVLITSRSAISWLERPWATRAEHLVLGQLREPLGRDTVASGRRDEIAG